MGGLHHEYFGKGQPRDVRSRSCDHARAAARYEPLCGRSLEPYEISADDLPGTNLSAATAERTGTRSVQAACSVACSTGALLPSKRKIRRCCGAVSSMSCPLLLCLRTRRSGVRVTPGAPHRTFCFALKARCARFWLTPGTPSPPRVSKYAIPKCFHVWRHEDAPPGVVCLGPQPKALFRAKWMPDAKCCLIAPAQ